MRTLKVLAVLVGIILFLIASCNVWLWSYTRSYFVGLLPEKIEISSIRYASGSCFFAVFDLSDKSVNEINQQGIYFFKGATKARAYDSKGDRYNRYHLYAEWQKTPVQDFEEKNTSFVEGLRCVSVSNVDTNFDQSLLKKIKLTAYSEGSFYTGHSQGQLVVLPSLGMAVIAGIGD